MARHEALAPDSTCHPEVWALLPWAVNGTLEGEDRSAIEERLATCPSCRAELARCHVAAAAVLATPARARIRETSAGDGDQVWAGAASTAAAIAWHRASSARHEGHVARRSSTARRSWPSSVPFTAQGKRAHTSG